MNESPTPSPAAAPAPVSAWKKPAVLIALLVLGCCLLTAFGTAWWVKRNIYASPLTPVQLSAQEQTALDAKLAQLEIADEVQAAETQPQSDADPRTITLSDKEINAYLARQGVGERVKVQLTRDKIAANFLLPIDENAPLFAGTTLRIRLALSALMNEAGKLVLKIDDISLGGIPLPNAWLGDIKGLDLIGDNLNGDPVLQRFAAGIKEVRLEEGRLRVVLNE